MAEQTVLYEGDTAMNHYRIVDGLYDGRPARVLYSGDGKAAQSGVAHDDEPDLLFDYNQRFLELAQNVTPERILVIGGGAYTLPLALLWALPDSTIDVVEPDHELQGLAERFFGLPVGNERLRHFHTDGRHFLETNQQKYDLIVIDAFVHTAIPRDLMTIEAARSLRRHLTDKGVTAMNVISGMHGRSAFVIRSLYAAYCQVFAASDIFYASRGYTLWLPQNFVLTGQVDATIPLKDYVRHTAITPPEINPNEALTDNATQ